MGNLFCSSVWHLACAVCYNRFRSCNAFSIFSALTVFLTACVLVWQFCNLVCFSVLTVSLHFETQFGTSVWHCVQPCAFFVCSLVPCIFAFNWLYACKIIFTFPLCEPRREIFLWFAKRTSKTLWTQKQYDSGQQALMMTLYLSAWKCFSI